MSISIEETGPMMINPTPNNPTDLSCDAWHVTGAKWAHSNSDDATLTNACKSKLPKTNFKFKIGWTGYIDWNESPFGKYGWSQDDTGRIVIALGNWWGFQRYVHGDVMVWYHKDQPSYVQCSSQTVREQIRYALDAYFPSH